ncbi:hypothetical protein ACN9MZ_23395 [Pseudoduganella sp. S-14]|jgi:hypothetical protein|uniref:hypothetical protein n=1 Tax=Pseudoduganella sp. S-14 TaxID=3404065 RepID=UPI003CEA4874
MLEGYVLRHEQLDAKGKIKRIITVNDWRQPRPGPNPDFDDRLLKTSAPLLIADLVFGTPGSKEKWKTREEFDKAFDTSEYALQVFPDRPMDDDE